MSDKTVTAYMYRAYPVDYDGNALRPVDDVQWVGPLTGVRIYEGPLTEVSAEKAAWLTRLTVKECQDLSPFWEVEIKSVEVSPWEVVGRLGWRAYAFPANARDWIPLWDYMSPLVEVAPVVFSEEPPFANNQLITPAQAAELNGDGGLPDAAVSDTYIVSLEWVLEKIAVPGL